MKSISIRLGRLLLRLILVAVVLVGAACGEKTPQLPRLGTSDVIVAFGDSLTYGTGAREEESYPAVLSQLIGLKVVGAGVPGEVTAQALQRLPAVIDEHQPKLMIVCIGGNDMLRKFNESQTRSNLRAIINTIRSRGIAVLLIGVPKPALLASPPEFYTEIASEFSIPYEGGIVKDVLYSTDMKSDPIHPNAKGYLRIAEAIAALLRKTGAI